MAPLSFIHKILLLASTLTSFTQALTIPSNNKRQSCENGPGSRNCWSDGFDIDTNYYNSWPDTGNTVSYDLHVTDTFCNPDGSGGKICQLINGQTPGPVIHAQWGDTISVTVHNELNYNGTAIHWHGIRQLHTNEQDGTNGVTECPTPPGTSKTYTFKATQYGTTWYHSHHTAQYGQGVVGAIVIDGPSTANYDEDLGVLPLTDWYYKSVYELLPGIMTIPGPPAPPDTVLVNGTMVDGNGNGQYQKLNVQPGKKYRLRFVNTAMDHLFHVSLDGHPFTVIEADFVPIQPYQTTDLKINVGQRYDVVFEANQNSGNYWLRVGSPAPGPGGALICGGAVVYSKNTTVVGAIVSYEGSGETWPTSSGYANDGSCRDEVIAPHFTTPMSGGYKLDALNITLTGPSSKVVNWFVNGSSMNTDWEHPTLSTIRDNQPFEPGQNVIEMPESNSWYLWVIENALVPPIPHPIHLHGHDFEILGAGVGAFPWGKDFVTGANPQRRDVATMPGSPSGGWLLLGVYTDNPGAWLMHCHIGWHASQGFSMQFVEQRDKIIGSIGSLSAMDAGCSAWDSYWGDDAAHGPKVDSGL